MTMKIRILTESFRFWRDQSERKEKCFLISGEETKIKEPGIYETKSHKNSNHPH